MTSKVIKGLKALIGFGGTYVASTVFYVAAVETAAPTMMLMAACCFAGGLLMTCEWMD